MTIELVAVDDAETRGAARHLIAEYLRWIASFAAASYGLSFDIDAMITSDIEDRAKFYPPAGRFYVIRRGESHVGVDASSASRRPSPKSRGCTCSLTSEESAQVASCCSSFCQTQQRSATTLCGWR